MRFRAILWAALLASRDLAQTSRGTETGTVMDSTGAVVPEAKVELRIKELHAKAGDVSWDPGRSLAAESLTDEPIELVRVGLKTAMPGSNRGDAMQTREPREPVLAAVRLVEGLKL